MIIEDHWETRQEYIKLGNELAALERKQQREKEQEEMMRKIQEKMAYIPSPSTVLPTSEETNFLKPQNPFVENNISKLQVEELRKGNTLVQNSGFVRNLGNANLQNPIFRFPSSTTFQNKNSSLK